MDIRKPRLIHNWREFLKEYAIIVIGVLTALGAEQAVEWAHWQGEVQIARKALREEIAAANRLYTFRIAFEPCAAKQEQEARAILDSLERKEKPTPFSVFHHSGATAVSDSEWQSERSSQVLTHFPRAELALMNSYYAQLPKSVSWTEEETAIWSELSVLQNPPSGLSPDSIARLRGLLDRTHRLDFLTVLFSHRMLNLSDRLGVARLPRSRAVMEAFCKTGDDKAEVGFLNAARKP